MEKKQKLIQYFLIVLFVALFYSCVSGGNSKPESKTDFSDSPVTLDNNAYIESAFYKNNYSLLLATTSQIKIRGNECNSVTSATVSSWDGSFTLVCNNNRYKYNFKDVGGKIQYTVIN